MHSQDWRTHIVESGCRTAEDIVEDKRPGMWAFQTLWVVGLVAVVTGTYIDYFGGLLRMLLVPFGLTVLIVGLAVASRYEGQRQVVGWWRQTLERPEPTSKAPGEKS